jgi:hypothetical protein
MLVGNEACQFRNQQSRTVVKLATMVLFGTRGPSLFQVIREGLGSTGRLHDRGTLRLANRLRLALEPECLENRRPPPEKIQGWSGLDQRHSNCLWFQILSVEVYSSLPHDQHDGGNLSCQGKSGHLRPHALGQQCFVKLLERARLR